MKTGLVMEGGAMRGMFTAGVLDVLMENNIEFDGAIGVSAGAAFGCNFKSKQIGRIIRYNKNFCRNWRFCSLRSLFLTGDIYGGKFCYETIPQKLDIFDTETFVNNPMDFYVVCTDMETGKAVYHNCLKADFEDVQWMRASASMPAVSKIIHLEGKKLSDGGTADSVPLKFFEEKGYEKNLVILTQPADYRKGATSHMGYIKLRLRKYPELIKALETRPERYNKNIEYVRSAEKEGRAFVIAPPEALNISSVCHDPDELERVYQIGRKEAEKSLDTLKKWMSNK